MNSVIDKTVALGFKASIGCPSALLDHQNGTQGAQNGTIRSSKSLFWVPGHTQEQHQGPKAS